jgi:hypothetical protein
MRPDRIAALQVSETKYPPWYLTRAGDRAHSHSPEVVFTLGTASPKANMSETIYLIGSIIQLPRGFRKLSRAKG